MDAFIMAGIERYSRYPLILLHSRLSPDPECSVLLKPAIGVINDTAELHPISLPLCGLLQQIIISGE